MPSDQTIRRKDIRLSAAELEFKYKREGQHPLVPLIDWRQAVINDDTLLGYWAWVEFMLSHMETPA